MLTVTIPLAPEVEARLRELADICNLTLEQYLVIVVGKDVQRHPRNPYRDDWVRRHNRRTPEEIAAARAEIDATSRPARPLPPGKTIHDMVEGTWPGDETDEQINHALRELS